MSFDFSLILNRIPQLEMDHQLQSEKRKIWKLLIKKYHKTIKKEHGSYTPIVQEDSGSPFMQEFNEIQCQFNIFGGNVLAFLNTFGSN